MPPSSDIKDLLVSAGLGVFAGAKGWAIHVGTEPAYDPQYVPHTTITLFDIPGAPRIRDANLRHPAVHVRVRGAPGDYTGAYNKALQVSAYLDSLSQATVNGAVYSVIARGEPSYLHHDEAGRPIFIADYDLLRSDS